MEIKLTKKQIKYLSEISNDIQLSKKLKKILNKKPMKISSKKAKGRRLQQYVCNKIAELFNIEYNQQDDQCPIHSREMGQSGVDIILRGDVFKKFSYAIECKNCEKISINKMIKQVRSYVDNNNQYQNWLIFYKNNKLPCPIVIIDVLEFFKIYKVKDND